MSRLALFLLSTVFSLLVLEGAARIVVTPSDASYGNLFGSELPPLRLIPSRPVTPIAATAAAAPTTAAPSAPSAPSEAIGWADFQGVFREDRVLGYAPRERTTSPHGWWIANDIGARSTVDTSPRTSPGRRRILVFGESYGSGSRVRQEDAWPTVLDGSDLDVVNLAVDGYGMAQSFLRFRAVTLTIDYDVAMLVFVPTADLWRDINTVRSLVHRSWSSYTVMPRFVLDHGRLTLVSSPYEVGSDVYADNPHGLGERLRTHLETYDRFYFRSVYEPTPLVGELVLWKLLASAYAAERRGALLRGARVRSIDLDGEAMRVSRAIFASMRDESHTHGKAFVLALLPEPHELRRMRASASVARKWDAVVSAVCDATFPCIDVAAALRAVPSDEIDRGYDKTHYGPRANRVVAAAMKEGLSTRVP